MNSLRLWTAIGLLVALTAAAASRGVAQDAWAKGAQEALAPKIGELKAVAAIPASAPEADKKLVRDFFRVVFEARNPEAAVDFLSEGYVQHNPTVPTGRD